MTRKRLNLAYITNDSVRKSTFNKTKNDLFKKVHDLSVLCGVEACAVIYSPSSSNPEVWPSNSGVKNVLEKFENVPEIKQEMRMVNHEDFLRQMITKTMERNMKMMKDNKERTLKEAMFHILRRGNNLQLTDQSRDALCEYIDQYLNKLYFHRNQMMNPAGVYAEHPNLNLSHDQYEQKFGGYPTVAQDGMMNPVGVNDQYPDLTLNQDQYQQKFGGFPIVAQDGMMNPVGVNDQNPNLNLNQDQYEQKFEGYPIVAQDGMMNPVGVNDQHPYLNLNQDQYEQKFGGYPIVAQDGMMNSVGVKDQHPNLNLNQDQYEQKFERYPIVSQDGMMNPVGVYDHHPNLNINHYQYEEEFGRYPIVAQDGIHKPNQMMMNQIDDNNLYFHQQS